MSKKALENAFVKNFVDVTTEKLGADKAAKLENKEVGDNGVDVGTKFTLTGGIKVVETNNDAGKTTAVWVALETKEKKDLSLQSLMGASSSSGYIFADSETNTAISEKLEDAEKVETTHTATAKASDFKNQWVPQTRDFLDLVAHIADNPDYLKGKTATYLGTMVKQITAKNDSSAEMFEVYEKGFKRAIVTKLWSIK
jgi:hypothetical protein